MPHDTINMTAHTREADGLTIRYAESGGEAAQTILLLSPCARLPDSKLDLLDTGHFTWEDGSEEYLRLARAWIEAHSIADPAG